MKDINAAKFVDLPEISAGRKAYFISDMHLGARYLADPRAHEARVVDFLRSIEDDCGVLFLVGDALDYWYEYRSVVPRGFVRFFGQLARMADKGTRIYWLTGNHDIWLFDYLRTEIGLEVVDGPMLANLAGHTFFIAHGDREGSQPWTMRALGSLFRNRLCQRLYAAVHPRWTVDMAMAWSSSSRGPEGYTRAEFAGPMREAVMQFCRSLLDKWPEIEYVVLGHHHVAVAEEIANNSELVILGDWFDRSVYAEFDGSKLELRQKDNE